MVAVDDVLSRLDDNLLFKILQYTAPSDSTRTGITNVEWKKRLLEDNMFSKRLWKTYSSERWGKGVLSSEVDQAEVSWYQYFRQRCSWWKKPLDTSPLDLIQEYWATDPYKLLTSCILCSRTSGGFIIRQVIRDFFGDYPTPTSVIEEDVKVLASKLHPLGLNREKTMKRFAADFLNLDWTNASQLHGCGAFAASSFDIFCRGDYKKVLKDKKADKNVKAFASYLKRLCLGVNVQVEVNKQRRHRVKRKSNAEPNARRMTRNRKSTSPTLTHRNT